MLTTMTLSIYRYNSKKLKTLNALFSCLWPSDYMLKPQQVMLGLTSSHPTIPVWASTVLHVSLKRLAQAFQTRDI